MTEHEIQQRILLSCGNGATRLWRNNVGTGWAGPATRVTAENRNAIAQSIRPGDVVVRKARPLHAGLCVGSSDLIGYRVIEHGGAAVAQLVALEVKAAAGRPTREQELFLSHVAAAGGMSGIVRSVEDAQRILS